MEQLADTFLDRIPDWPNFGDALASGVVQLPIEIALAGDNRAGVAAAHGHDNIGPAHGLVSPRLWGTRR